MVNIIGKKFGRLTVIDIDKDEIVTAKYKQKYVCLCDCGNYTKVRYGNLVSDHTRSCGCLVSESHTKRIENLSGKRFGRLTAISIKPTNKWGVHWLCECDCGNFVVVLASHLKSGHTKSCGCWLKESSHKVNLTHGMATSRIYTLWRAMKQRCTNPSVYNYCDYGGRGISVCDEWLTFENFYSWAMKNGYSDELSIDRINNDAGYSPENCRWVDAKTQANNRRSNKVIEYNNERHTLSEWSSITGIKAGTLNARLQKGWPVEKALFTPVKIYGSSL